MATALFQPLPHGTHAIFGGGFSTHHSMLSFQGICSTLLASSVQGAQPRYIIGTCEELIYLIPAKYPGLSGNKSKQLGIFRSLRVGIEKNDATIYLIPYLWIT
ncbi:TPA: hypothetical protein ACIJVJ_002476 [Raoultella planticola]